MPYPAGFSNQEIDLVNLPHRAPNPLPIAARSFPSPFMSVTPARAGVHLNSWIIAKAMISPLEFIPHLMRGGNDTLERNYQLFAFGWIFKFYRLETNTLAAQQQKPTTPGSPPKRAPRSGLVTLSSSRSYEQPIDDPQLKQR